MKRLTIGPLFVAITLLSLLAFILGFILYFQNGDQADLQKHSHQVVKFSYQTGEWKSTVEGLEQFNPNQADAQLETRASGQAERLANDGEGIDNNSQITLLGLLKKEYSTAIIQNSWVNENQEQRSDVLRLNVGESTPDGWKLVNIQGDLSMWLNEQSEQTLNLALFDSYNKKQTEVNK